MNKKRVPKKPPAELIFKTSEERLVAKQIREEQSELKILSGRDDLTPLEHTRVMALRRRYHGHYSPLSTSVWGRVLFQLDQFNAAC